MYVIGDIQWKDMLDFLENDFHCQFQVQKGQLPRIMNAMSKRRAAKLISLAMVNKMGEVWICKNPNLAMAQFNAAFPNVFYW